MNKKLIGILFCMMLIGISMPVIKSTVVNNSVHNNSGPILEIMIFSRFSLLELVFIVDNIGNAMAHNITYSGIDIVGNVLYNSKAHFLTEEIEPETGVYGWSDRFIGFGKFTATITVTCDEGYIATASTNGIVFGPFYYIP